MGDFFSMHLIQPYARVTRVWLKERLAVQIIWNSTSFNKKFQSSKLIFRTKSRQSKIVNPNYRTRTPPIYQAKFHKGSCRTPSRTSRWTVEGTGPFPCFWTSPSQPSISGTCSISKTNLFPHSHNLHLSVATLYLYFLQNK